jgi:hypothetical protein
MKQVLIAVAGLLVAAAKARAEHVMRTQADARIQRDEVYSANAGGWN